MNKVLQVGAASALAFGVAAAHATITEPSSGGSDAILFAEVVNGSGTAVASYAGDTGISISTLVSGVSGTTTALTGDSNLSKLFAADAAGDTLYWAIEGGQYTGNANAPGFSPTGAAQFITTSTNNGTGKLAVENTGNLIKWATLSKDVATLNTNLAGANSVEGSSPATAGLWDFNTPNGISAWYNNGPVTGNTTTGAASPEELFYVTGGGSTPAKVAYSNPNSEVATLTSGGLTIKGAGGSPPPVPLPAAVWLLGSGLLGLAGVGRRKSKA